MLNETIIGYMANNIFPFRLGELYRVNRIVNSEQNKFTRVLSTIFTERLFDVISLVIIMIFAFPFIKEFDFKLFQLKKHAHSQHYSYLHQVCTPKIWPKSRQ